MVEAVVSDELPHLGDRRLLLVHGRYSPAEEATLQVDGRRTHVVERQSVLGVVDAWLDHRAHGGNDLLVVVVHPLDDEQLGWDVRGHAARRGTLMVDLATIVQRRFGATDLDPRVRQNDWLVKGLLDAEPAAEWRRGGPVLTLDVAIRALLAARLGLDDPPGRRHVARLVPGAGAGPLPRVASRGARRAHRLAHRTRRRGGRGAPSPGGGGGRPTAMALGVVAAVLDEPQASPDTAVAVGGLLGAARIGPVERRAFVAAVEGVLERWVSTAEDGGAAGEDAGAPRVRGRRPGRPTRGRRRAHRGAGRQRLPALGVPGAPAHARCAARPGVRRTGRRCSGRARRAARTPPGAAAPGTVRGRGDGRPAAPVACHVARSRRVGGRRGRRPGRRGRMG